MTDPIAHLDDAILRGGGIIAFADKMGVTHQSVYGWKRRSYVPALRALQIEQLFGIPRTLLMHPDLAEAYLTPSTIL